MFLNVYNIDLLIIIKVINYLKYDINYIIKIGVLVVFYYFGW